MKTPKIDPNELSLADWLAQARRQLSRHGEDAGVEARAMAGFVLQQSSTWIQAHPEQVLDKSQLDLLVGLLARLKAGEPLPYLTGRQEFYGLDFMVNDSVLIPRPETELLVEHALRWLAEHPRRRLAADVGTGSGCIAVSLAAHCPDLQVLAIDRSPDALETARQNAGRHKVEERIHFQLGDLLAAQPGPFDLVCANLPYIPSADVKGLEVSRHEPRLALDGGPDGLGLIHKLLGQLPTRLASGGLALLEIEYRQGPAVSALAGQVFPSAQVRVLKDLVGLDRVVEIIPSPHC